MKIFDCFCKYEEEIDLDPHSEDFPEIVSWFCERLVTVQRDEALHQAAHMVFDNVPCAHLHQYARTSMRVLVGAELASMCLRNAPRVNNSNNNNNNNDY